MVSKESHADSFLRHERTYLLNDPCALFIKRPLCIHSPSREEYCYFEPASPSLDTWVRISPRILASLFNSEISLFKIYYIDGNYTRMLRAILNKSWRQHPTKHQLYGHLPPITKTIQVRRTRHVGHCWRSSDVLLWIPTYGRAKAGRSAQTYIQQLCEDTGCSPEDLPEVMNDREKWQERVRDIRASGMTWWWWWYRFKSLKIWILCKWEELQVSMLITYSQLYAF